MMSKNPTKIKHSIHVQLSHSESRLAPSPSFRHHIRRGGTAVGVSSTAQDLWAGSQRQQARSQAGALWQSGYFWMKEAGRSGRAARTAAELLLQAA